jgi:lipoprotein-anchoring transpeptidase ErfK/SrfK
MRRLWMSLVLAPVTAVTVASAAWASSAAPAAPGAQAGPAGRAAHAAQAAPGASSLPSGMSRAEMRKIQRRLAALHYYPGKIDGRLGTDTVEAIWAFYEVQGLKPHSYVNAAMKRALAHPKAPRVLVRRPAANRIEVNLTREVLVLYRNNKVQLISHVSTGGHYYYCSRNGCGYAVTPTGNFRTTAYMPGWVHVPLGEMYNPVFFIGTAFAIHGDSDVPLAPVSHGCVRIPMHIAAFFHKLVKVPGERVYIRY